MSAPLPLGNQAPVPDVPGIRQVSVSCCGYVSHQGIPKPWECPGCRTVHSEHIPVPAPADAGG